MKMPYKQNKKNIFSIAPMMGKTDAFFCMLLNLINKDVNIYTEMIHAETIIRSNVLDNYKKLDNISRVSLQIAGNNPKTLSKASILAEDIGFKEININCGCPSPRVLSGEFGISLLEKPQLVAECVNEIKNKVSCEISIKTRIGINYENNDAILDFFLETLNKADIKKYIIHARNAIIKNISAKKNLLIPKLNYERVYRLKNKFKNNIIIINGGFLNTTEYNNVLRKVDGIMIGREAYKNPWIFDEKHSIGLNKKKNIVLTYLSILEKRFNNKKFDFKALFHLYNIFNNLAGSKEWKRKINSAIKEKSLTCLFNYLRYHKI